MNGPSFGGCVIYRGSQSPDQVQEVLSSVNTEKRERAKDLVQETQSPHPSPYTLPPLLKPGCDLEGEPSLRTQTEGQRPGTWGVELWGL